MKREVRRPSATAASTCAVCFKAGTVSREQNATTSTLRFTCASGHAWDTDREQAEAHGRFVQRITGA